jgi:hypothetical protein
LEGSLLLVNGNRVREDIRERSDRPPLFKLLVSDGLKWWWHAKVSPSHLVRARIDAVWTTRLTSATPSSPRGGLTVV